VRDCVALVERGFDAVKVKLGRPDPREDLRREAAVRKAVGDGIDLMTDVNCAGRWRRRASMAAGWRTTT
jgi:L-alanine-DL-glutamate epimerase-like enolase superfamily enzyme